MKILRYALTGALLLATLTACGSGSTSSSTWPLSNQSPGASYVQSIAFRNHTTMAWGNNGYGQLGNSSSGNSLTPVAVADLPRVAGIVTGGTHSLAFKNLSGVWAWGNNGYGQLGNGTTTASYKPAKVFKNNTSAHTYLDGVTAVAAGGNHSLALDATGTVWSWGGNTWSQLGNDAPTGYNMTALPVLTSASSGKVFTAVKISAGGGFNLTLDASPGRVWAWGNNASGQLGDGTIVTRNFPVLVGTLSSATAIAAGGSHSLALLSDGTVVSWGYNKYGQLGNKSTVDALFPVPVVDANNIPLSGVVAIAAGLDHSLALDVNGKVWGWGYNVYGQLGQGTTTDSNVAVPITIPGLPFIDRILAIGYHSLAFSGGKGWSWGDNTYGQVGNNSTTNVLAPVPISGYP